MNKKLLHLFACVCVGVMIAGCATVGNNPIFEVTVEASPEPVRYYLNHDTSTIFTSRSTIQLPRSKDTFVITVENDSLSQEYTIPARLSRVYTLGNLCTYGVGYLVDLASIKRYSYPSILQFSSDSLQLLSSIGDEISRMQMDVRLALAYGNITRSGLFAGPYLNRSLDFGLNFGMDYYIKRDLRLSFDFGFVARDTEHYYDDSQNSTYFAIQLGSYTYKEKLHYSLGLQCTQMQRDYRNQYNQLDTYGISNYGLAGSLSYRLSRHTMIGVDYYPSFIRSNFGFTRFEYSHLVQLKAGFVLNLLKK